MILRDAATGHRQTGAPLQQHATSVQALAVHPRHDWALTGDDKGTLLLWELRSGQVLRRFAGHTANEFVDGMDVMAVREATLRAIERARKDSKPTLLEIRAYRFMGHSMSDPGNYRTRAEIAKYQERDPIVLFKDSLKVAGVFGDKDFEQIEIEAVEAVASAVKFADESPYPDESELLKDVFA